eukprot:8141903-Karenia_brevis.AAC.1
MIKDAKQQHQQVTHIQEPGAQGTAHAAIIVQACAAGGDAGPGKGYCSEVSGQWPRCGPRNINGSYSTILDLACQHGILPTVPPSPPQSSTASAAQTPVVEGGASQGNGMKRGHSPNSKEESRPKETRTG